MKHCECNNQTICKITKQCFTANSTEEHMFTCVQKESYIKAAQLILKIFKMAAYNADGACIISYNFFVFSLHSSTNKSLSNGKNNSGNLKKKSAKLLYICDNEPNPSNAANCR